MKRVILYLFSAALLLGSATAALAEGVTGTPHDVNVMQGTTGLEPCAMCHTPHKGAGVAPIWNRTQETVTYTAYKSPSLDMATNGIANLPQNPSSLCLVCHNGVTSKLVNYPGSGSYEADHPEYSLDLSADYANLGTGMQDDHPLSFTYDPADDTDGNVFPTILTVNGRKYVDGVLANYPLFDNAGAASDKAQFECATCHSVHHNGGYDPATTGEVFFLRVSNVNSQFCKDCHTKK